MKMCDVEKGMEVFIVKQFSKLDNPPKRAVVCAVGGELGHNICKVKYLDDNKIRNVQANFLQPVPMIGC